MGVHGVIAKAAAASGEAEDGVGFSVMRLYGPPFDVGVDESGLHCGDCHAG